MNTSTLSPEASAIERIEHIQKKICMMWASPELDTYLNSLLMDSRDGKRQGFPVDITQDLLFLAEFNKFVRAIEVAKKLQISLKEAYQKVDFDDRTKSGTGLDDPLSAGDVYAREASLMGIGNSKNARVSNRPPKEAGDGVGASIGKLIFSLLTNQVVIFLIVLAIIFTIVRPYLFK